MTNSIMTITSSCATNLYTNQQRFEISKRGLKKEVNTMYFYEKTPVKLVTGMGFISKIEKVNPKQFLIENQLNECEISFINQYLDYNELNVYWFNEVVKFDEPKTLAQLGKKAAPQSISYLEIKS